MERVIELNANQLADKLAALGEDEILFFATDHDADTDDVSALREEDLESWHGATRRWFCDQELIIVAHCGGGYNGTVSIGDRIDANQFYCEDMQNLFDCLSVEKVYITEETEGGDNGEILIV